MEEYNGSEEFSHYMERLEFFFTTNSIDDVSENVGRRKAISLSVIGSKIYGIIGDLLALNRLTEIVEVLKNHFQKMV